MFAELVAESFFSEAQVNWRLLSATHAVARFHVESVLAEVDFEQREEHGPWHVGFNTDRGDEPDRAYISLAFSIFNGVFQAVKEFMETREPEVVVVTAKDKGLANIYATYLRREQTRIEELGYRMEGPQQAPPYTEWILRRTRPSAWRQ